MSRWIFTSFALHLAFLVFVCVMALFSKPEKKDEIFMVDLAVGLPAPPEPAATPAPPEPTAPPATEAPTPKKEVTKAPTKPPAKKETPKKEPTKKATPKKQPTKKVVDRSPRKLPNRLRPKAPPPPPPPDHSDLLKELEKKAKEIEKVVNEPIPTPRAVRTVPPPRTVPPRAHSTTPNPALDINPLGMGRQSSNFYFVLMQRQFYKNWELKERQPGEPARKADITVVVLKDGTIDIGRCRWNTRSGKTEFDDSVWEAVEKTELPKLPDEFRMSEIQVAVTFRDEV